MKRGGRSRPKSKEVRASADGRITEQEVTLRLPALRERRAALAGELSSLGNASVVKLHPPAVKIYLRDLRQLDRVINSDLERGIDPAADTIRAMIETVTIVPAVAPGAPEIIIRGDLAAALSGGDGGKGIPYCLGSLRLQQGLEPLAVSREPIPVIPRRQHSNSIWHDHTTDGRSIEENIGRRLMETQREPFPPS
jgi:hypothetical protein